MRRSIVSRTNPVVVITGASSGIGRATALRFARRKHASLVLAGRREKVLADLVEECGRLGGTAIAVPTEVSSEESVRALADAAMRRFERIDVWVNAAAVSVFSPFLDMPMNDFRRVIDVNLMGYVYGARVALQVMTEQRSGTVINVASIVGEVPQPYTTPYGMSKAAVRALGVSLRSELGLQKLKHVHVSTVLPATIDTPFFQHAANYTGRAVLAMPPVYPAAKVAKAIEKVSESPRAEVVVGAAGKLLVHQHRRTPEIIDAQMALQTEMTHLSRTKRAESTEGILFTPAPDEDAQVSGGWHGRGRTRMRRILTWGFILGVGAAMAAQSRGSQRAA
jgi:NAD(P)-dependent dehydrogenase (short-subunit alcohol dehydrogenase family)